MDCKHESVKPTVVDQTLGVMCLRCDMLLAWCWMERHMSERLWNKACENDAGAKRCENDREDVCALCGDKFNNNPVKDAE